MAVAMVTLATLTFAFMVAFTLAVDPAFEQIHLAYGVEPNTVNVAWVTQEDSTVNRVLYGPAGSGNLSATAEGDSRKLAIIGSGSRVTHVAVLEGIEEGGNYSYKVVQDSAESEVFTFTLRKQHGTGVTEFGRAVAAEAGASADATPDLHIIFGDMGASHAFSLCDACTAASTTCDVDTCSKNTSVGLVSEVDNGAAMFLHVGDFAYNFDSEAGTFGDQFMHNIQQVAARLPYMVSHGNHEDSPANLGHYIERFRNMPANSNATVATLGGLGGTNSLYYSWDSGLVHYIALSTELWFSVGEVGVGRESQLAWLEEDLKAAAANRDKVPWIIAHGHRDIYCSTSDDDDCNNSTTGDAGRVRKDLEPLFFKYGLDLWINGHEHSYERTYPVYEGKSDRSNVDPKATIYIVTGAAGSPEMHEAFTNTPPSWSAFRSNTFGYSRMWVHNETHIHWQQVQTDPTLFPLADYGRVIDDTWIIQHSHGPFNETEAPTGHAFPPGHDSPRRTHDHWAELLGLGYNGTVALSQLIQEYRDKFGDDAWGAKEAHMMRHVNHLIGSQGKTKWEDVRGDGSSDGEYFRWIKKHPHNASEAA